MPRDAIPCDSIECKNEASYTFRNVYFFCSQKCADFILEGSEYFGKPLREIPEDEDVYVDHDPYGGDGEDD